MFTVDVKQQFKQFNQNSRIPGLVKEKKIRVRLFFMYMPHLKFQDSSISGSRVSQLPSITDIQTDGQTDRRTDRPEPICPLNFSEVAGINIENLANIKQVKQSTTLMSNTDISK